MVVLSASVVHRFFFWGGWNSLVAIGTLALASATYSLMRGTRQLASASDAEVRAQWRPVLIARDVVIDANDEVRLRVENVGRGPALASRAELAELSRPDPGIAYPRNVVVPVNEPLEFSWNVELERRSTLGSLICEDVSGGTCGTIFIISDDLESVTNVEFTVNYSDPLAVRWWQRTLRRRVIRRRLGFRS